MTLPSLEDNFTSFSKKPNELRNQIIFASIFALVFIVGFSVGYVRAREQNQKQAEQVISNLKANEVLAQETFISNTPSVPASQPTPESSNSQKQTLSNVFWIRPGVPPNCPPSHQIKAKVDTDSLLYYMPDSKSYGRGRPHLCFDSEQSAINEGFIRKF